MPLSKKELDILERGLPKWPQMLVNGESVTIDQAKEIIRRTDITLLLGYGGNDRKYRDQVLQTVGRPDPKQDESFPDYMSKLEVWGEAWGMVETDYVRNDWIASCFVYGPAGWCHPDGTIYHHYNVGKWPSGMEVYQDWVKLADAFPFLDLKVVLMDREHGEENKQPVMAFRVQSGQVRVVDPKTEPLVVSESPRIRELGDKYISSDDFGLEREKGIPYAWIEEWGEAFQARR